MPQPRQSIPDGGQLGSGVHGLLPRECRQVIFRKSASNGNAPRRENETPIVTCALLVVAYFFLLLCAAASQDGFAEMIRRAQQLESQGHYQEAASVYEDLVRRGEKLHRTRAQIFSLIWQAAHHAAGFADQMEPPEPVLLSRAAIPYLNEPWYC